MNKHKAIDPNGKVHTRNSKTRTYLYTVVGRSSYDNAVACAKSDAMRKQDIANFNWLKGRCPERVSDYADGNAYADARVAKVMADIEKKLAEGYYEEYGSLGWQSRLDLAEKCVAQWAKRGLVDLTILKVDVS